MRKSFPIIMNNIWQLTTRAILTLSIQIIATLRSVFYTSQFKVKYVQWNLSVTTTSLTKFITCDLFSNVF